MRNLEDAAIHLQQNIEEMPIEYLLGNTELLKAVRSQKPMVPFSERTVDFLSMLSQEVKALGRGSGLPDISAFSFWCRRAHLNQLKTEYTKEEEVRLGRGVSLHFAPGNIPTQFAYTAVAGLLTGNCAVVRLSQKKTEQEQIIIKAVKNVIENGFEDFNGRLMFLRYAHDSKITELLSKMCDVRIMWGSNESVNNIRKAPLLSGAVDLPFGARDSAAVFSVKKILNEEDLKPLCREFYNDTYLNDQNACSSPHIIFWLGKKPRVKEAREKFWNCLYEVLDEKDWHIQAETAVRKLSTSFVAAAQVSDIKIERNANKIVRLYLDSPEKEQDGRLNSKLWNYSEPGGFFIECTGEKIEDFLPVLDRTCQTVSVFGIDRQEFAKIIAENSVTGVDRIVETGHTLDFELTWDGFNMVEYMSRKINYR